MNLEKWYVLKDKTAALSLRERVILLLAVLACVSFIWAQFFYLGFEKKLKQAQLEMRQQQQVSVEQSDQLSLLMTRLAHDPNAVLLKEQASLQTKLDALKQDIEERLRNLIEPELMADVMKKVLSDYQGLRLISAKNLPAAPLEIESKGNAEKQDRDSKAQAVLFSHAFQMELKGDYFQTLAFLKRLEEMKGFYWTMLHYEVEDYPQARIMLQLSTLSLEEGWIGV